MAELLFVGPENGVLGKLSRGLSRAEPDWSIRRIDDSASALEYMERRPVDLVLACLSPGNGSAVEDCEQLLGNVLKIAPHAIRFSLLECEDGEQCSVRHAHQSLAVRGDLDYLGPIIAAGLEVADRVSDYPVLARLIENLHKVPSPPILYFDIREQLDNRDSTLASMADVTARDPALVASILKMANSGFYALPRTVCDLPEAIGLIGADALLGLVLAAHLYAGLPPPGLNLETLWQHTMKVSALARQITRIEGGDRQAQNTSAIAGLLHDIGLLVLLENEPVSYQPLWSSSGGDEAALARMERDTFGVSHGELGALILTLWSLPEEVINAVANSHAVEPSDLSLTSQAVLAAEWLSESSGQLMEAVPLSLKDLPEDTFNRWRDICENLANEAGGV